MPITRYKEFIAPHSNIMGYKQCRKVFIKYLFILWKIRRNPSWDWPVYELAMKSTFYLSLCHFNTICLKKKPVQQKGAYIAIRKNEENIYFSTFEIKWVHIISKPSSSYVVVCLNYSSCSSCRCYELYCIGSKLCHFYGLVAGSAEVALTTLFVLSG